MSWEDVFGLDGSVVKGIECGMGNQHGDIEEQSEKRLSCAWL